jgi:hypothetical protein
MADLGKLTAEVSANVNEFTRNMQQASGDLQQMGNTADQAGKKAEAGLKRAEMASKALKIAAAASVAAIAGAAAALIKMTTDGLRAADEQAKLARQLGFTNHELATLERAADFSGVSMGTLTTATRRLDTELGNALGGVEASEDRFTKLGLSVEELALMRPDERLKTIGDAIGQLGTHAEKTAAANDIFGRSGQEMMLLLADAAPMLERASGEVETFGLALQNVDSERIESINDNISTLQQATRGAALQMANGLAPGILAVTDKLVDMANDSTFMRDVIDGAIKWIIRAFGALGDAIQQGILTLRHLERGFRQLQVTALQAIRQMDDQMFAMFRRFAEGWQGVVDAMGIFGGAISGGPVGEAFRRMFSDQDAQEFRSRIDGTITQTQARIRDLTAMIEGGADAPKFSDWLNQVFADADAERAERARTDAEGFLIPELLGIQQQIEDDEQAHQDNLTTIVEQGVEDRTDLIIGGATMVASNLASIYSNLASATEKDEEKLFNIQKNARTAQAIIDGIGATVASYRVGASIGGPAVGAAFAATAAAATAAQVAAIQSQSFSGGSRTVTPPPTSSTAGSSGPQGSIFINLQGGDMFSGGQVRDLMDRIAEAQRDGYRVVV